VLSSSSSSSLFVDDVIVGSTVSSVIRSVPNSTVVGGGAGVNSDETSDTTSSLTTTASSPSEPETATSRRNLSRISSRVRITSSILALRLFPLLLARNASVVVNPAAPHCAATVTHPVNSTGTIDRGGGFGFTLDDETTAIKRVVVVLPSLVDAGGARHLVPSLFRAPNPVVARAFSSIDDDDGTLGKDEDDTGGVSFSASSLALAPHRVVVVVVGWNTVG
jgi:hypothetical protein